MYRIKIYTIKIYKSQNGPNILFKIYLKKKKSKHKVIKVKLALWFTKKKILNFVKSWQNIKYIIWIGWNIYLREYEKWSWINDIKWLDKLDNIWKINIARLIIIIRY